VVKSRVAASDLARDIRSSAIKVQTKLEKAATRYMENEITASQYLKICGSIYGAAFDQ
jgi:hypothetical protein